jgi:C1A family cysteine protease
VIILKGRRKMIYTFWRIIKMVYHNLLWFFIAFFILSLYSPSVAQEQVSPAISPINPDFLNFFQKLHTRHIQASTEKGFGHIPPVLDLSYLKGLQILPTEELKISYPISYDLRQLGKISPIRDQGACGDCWAFATYGSLESILLPLETWDFSENNLKNTHGFDWLHCDGGNQFISMAYLARWSGPINEIDDPYNPYSNVSPVGINPVKHIRNVLLIPDRSGPHDNDNIKWAVMNYGALYTSYYHNDSYYNSTTHSYYYNGTNYSNHAVAIVGWDDNYSRYNFSTVPPGDGAFIIKNSWGSGWGENGYFYVSYYDSKIGTDNAIFNDVDPNTNYDRIYQYDPLGWVLSIGYGSNTAWFSNVFNSTGNEKLESVSLYTASPNSSYEIYVYTNVSSLPTSGVLARAFSGSISLPGYHTISLSTPVPLPSGKFSIVVKLTTPGYNYPVPIEYPYNNYSSNATAGPGQSYVSSDGINWTDITNYYANTNVCLKAFSINTYTLSISIEGTGSGIVTSNIGNINCGTICADTFDSSTLVILTATNNNGSIFNGWGGNCLSCGTNPSCQITMNSNKTCSATFTVATNPDLTGAWISLNKVTPWTRIVLKGTLRVSNIGGPMLPKGFRIYFYLSENGYTLGRLMGITSLSSVINTGSFKDIPVTLYSRIPIEGKYVIAIIDARNEIDEMNETNNRVSYGPIP